MQFVTPRFTPETEALFWFPHVGVPVMVEIGSNTDHLERQRSLLETRLRKRNLGPVARFKVASANSIYYPPPVGLDEMFVGTLTHDPSSGLHNVIVASGKDRWLLTFDGTYLDLPIPAQAMFACHRHPDGTPNFAFVPASNIQRLPPLNDLGVDANGQPGQEQGSVGSSAPPLFGARLSSESQVFLDLMDQIASEMPRSVVSPDNRDRNSLQPRATDLLAGLATGLAKWRTVSQDQRRHQEQEQEQASNTKAGQGGVGAGFDMDMG